MHEEDETKKSKIGKWKVEQNYIFNYEGERFDFATPAEVPEQMHGLLNKTNAIDSILQSKKSKHHPIDIALQFHLEYVAIHPFYDGNGRTARILTNLILISLGYPPFWVKKEERTIYHQYIGNIQGYGGNPDLFYDCVADMILRSQKIMLDAVEGRDMDEQDDLDKEILILQKQLQGVDVINQDGDVANITRVLGSNVLPIFKMIEEKCAPFKEFFIECTRKISFETEDGMGRQTIHPALNTWEQIKNEWCQTRIKNQHKKLIYLRYEFELKGFKKTVAANSFFINVEIYFNEYNYGLVSSNVNISVQFPYGLELSMVDKENIVRPLIKNLIENIKKNIRN